MTWAQAKRDCRALGFTLKPTGFGSEHALYVTGTRKPMEHDSTYFTTCANDAAETARKWRGAIDSFQV